MYYLPVGGGQQSEMKLWAGLVLPEALRTDPFHGPLLASGDCLSALGIPCR